ncbi:MAG: acetate--CoA ligase family protein [Candidatus Jordarchaeum sp.]|uniref:acetate--CoA ligase family protein n=1 Tax=Candidatus Jordarchaeum sp. TaxID=2823881 RepID=UPI00404A62A7
MPKDLISQINALFNPSSIAVLGVSDKKFRLGNFLLSNFIDIGYEGKLYPINPDEETIMGLKSYPSLKDIDETVDLLVISLHPDKVPQVIEEAVEKNVKGAIIFSSGYGEKGNEGRLRERELVEIARKGNLRIIGPNCMGFYCPSTKLSFFPGLSKESGPVAFISQSGSLSNIVAFAGEIHGFGFSKMISLGNSCDLDVNDFLEYLGSDHETKIIACYLEGVEDGRRFLRLAKRISRKKPIIVWKVGWTKGGAKAAGSHTGSICGNKEIWDAVFKQAGLIRVENLSELFGRLGAFINPYLPNGNRVVVICAPGGAAVSTADACEKAGLELAELSEETKNKMAEIIPEFGTSVSNPVDMGLIVTYDKTIYPSCTEIAGRDENVDMVLVFHFVIDKELAENLVDVQKRIKKPMAVATNIQQLLGKEFGAIFKPFDTEEMPNILKKFYESGISFHSTEQDAARTLMSLLEYRKFLEKSNRETGIY